MVTHCFALDLKDDAQLIEEYKEYHRNVWPEIENSIKESGIQKLEIEEYNNTQF